MNSRYLILLAGLVCAQVASAQGYDTDALLVSQTTAFGSTARVQGIGGTQISLGGDISVAGSNPAGLGFYNRSVFSFTPTINFHNTEGIYNGELTTAFQPNFNMPNLGVVLNHNVGDYSNQKFKGGSFAISATRINDFNQQFSYTGVSSRSSIVDSFLDIAGTTVEDDLPELAFAAWDNYLISPDVNSNNEITGYSIGNGVDPVQPEQSELVTTSGGQNQLNFSWGGNYNDKIYFGGGLGIQTIRYKRKRYFSERDFVYPGESASYQPISQITMNDELKLDGTGINATFGMIVRPVNFITVGFAYTSPTYFAMNSEYGFDLAADYNNFQTADTTLTGTRSYQSVIFANDYSVKTPGKIAVGGSVFIGKQGFLSADIEYVDYGSMLLQSNDYELDLSVDNQNIVKNYTSVLNFKAGWRI